MNVRESNEQTPPMLAIVFIVLLPLKNGTASCALEELKEEEEKK